MEINLISYTIPHKDSYANMWYPDKDLSVRKNNSVYSGVTVFTDESILYVDQVSSSKKVAWLIEPPVIKSQGYSSLKQSKELRDKFDLILTFDDSLIALDPKKIKLFPFGSCWISKHNCVLSNKTKKISIVASSKNYAPGHRLRHRLIAELKANGYDIDLYGSGYNEFPHTDEGRLMPFKDYKFSIVIENSKMNNYFTDKILDCFAVGTIPIYWGADNIYDFFDQNGIITFDGSLDSIKWVYKNFDELYEAKQQSIANNYTKYVKFESPDRNLRLLLESLYA